ncbi:MAG: aminopeptidase [Pseudomonadota bacterium]
MLTLTMLVALATLATASLGGCSRTSFYLQAARGQWALVRAREPLDEVLAGDELDPALRPKLELAHDARQFAVNELALPDNKSYQTYVQLDRSHVLWNVIAAPEFSVDPKVYCFPFAGCVSYRGFFREEAARRETERLQEDGLDAFYGGVGAYSTLGQFADPILSSMLTRADVEVAAVLFHELAHQVVYRPSDATFSESFASFVEREGVKRYLAARGRSADFDRYLTSLDRREQFATLVSGARDELRALYALPLPEAEKRRRKSRAIDGLRARYESLKASWDGYAGYDNWFGRDLNNAHLSSVSTYTQWVPAFGALLAEHDGDLPAFYAAVEALAKQEDGHVQARLIELDEAAR